MTGGERIPAGVPYGDCARGLRVLAAAQAAVADRGRS